jgi:hypothetical protein
MARLLRVGLEYLFKLLFRVDEGHRVTGLTANIKEVVNGWDGPSLTPPTPLSKVT